MKFTYTGESRRVFVTVRTLEGRTLDAIPGEVYDLSEAPNNSFVLVKTKQKAPESPVAPATPDPATETPEPATEQ